jgi:hypothetical protein
VLVVVSGCLGAGVQADGVRDEFVHQNTSSYVYDGETSYSFNAPGGPTRTTTIDFRAVVNRTARSLRANISSVTEGAGRSAVSGTTTYLVNRTVYTRSVREGDTTGWTAFGTDAEVENTWSARDELRLYEHLLRNASVEHNRTEAVRGTDANRIDVELGDRRAELLAGKFRDGVGFFEEGETETFRTTVWITDDGRLLRAETRAGMVLRNRTTATGRTDLNVDLTFSDTFRYGDVPTVEVPQKALNATRVR